MKIEKEIQKKKKKAREDKIYSCKQKKIILKDWNLIDTSKINSQNAMLGFESYA